MTMDAMLCEHANEVPSVCHCPIGCYCKVYTCRDSKMTDVDATVVVSEDEEETIELIHETVKFLVDLKQKGYSPHRVVELLCNSLLVIQAFPKTPDDLKDEVFLTVKKLYESAVKYEALRQARKTS